MESKFKIGDLVQFIGGGPIMVVFYVNQVDETAPIGCKYWAGPNFDLADFSHEHLQKVKRTLTIVNDVVEAKFELDPSEEERERFGLIKTTSTICPPKYVELNKEFRFDPNEPQF